MFTIDWVNKNTKFIKAEFMAAVGLGVRDTLKEFKKDFESVTGNWDPPPVFTLTKDSISTPSKKFLWINKGTNIRKRIMSGDWVSKTTPNSLRAGSGAGRALGFGFRPGIEARNFDLASAERQIDSGLLPGLIAKRIRQRAKSIFR